MLQENIQTFRKERGLTQEELAIRVNVVRQTVSKWEKGLSVPDADMLQRISEVLEVPVSQLLGEEKEKEQERNEIAEQLARINEQLAIRNRRAKRIWTALAAILCAAVVILGTVLVMYMLPREEVLTVTGADGGFSGEFTHVVEDKNGNQIIIYGLMEDAELTTEKIEE